MVCARARYEQTAGSGPMYGYVWIWRVLRRVGQTMDEIRHCGGLLWVEICDIEFEQLYIPLLYTARLSLSLFVRTLPPSSCLIAEKQAFEGLQRQQCVHSRQTLTKLDFKNFVNVRVFIICTRALTQRSSNRTINFLKQTIIFIWICSLLPSQNPFTISYTTLFYANSRLLLPLDDTLRDRSRAFFFFFSYRHTLLWIFLLLQESRNSDRIFHHILVIALCVFRTDCYKMNLHGQCAEPAVYRDRRLRIIAPASVNTGARRPSDAKQILHLVAHPNSFAHPAFRKGAGKI